MYRVKFRYSLLGIFFVLAAKPASLEASTAKSTTSLLLQKKERVMQLYAQKRYEKANALLETILPAIKDKIERSDLHFCRAYCNFYEKNYLVASNQFELFVKQYPFDARTEEALFMKGYSLAQVRIDTFLDQTTTYDAMHCLERYLAKFPTGNYLHQATQALQKLQHRLLKKEFEAARLYAQLGHYRAAVVALVHFKEDHPESLFHGQVLELLVRCYTQLAKHASNEVDHKERIDAVQQCSSQLRNYVQARSTTAPDLRRNKKDKKDVFTLPQPNID
ncbi:MAG TPA: outer membrane protein assembly factor BamD [Amoebophilaceae bacterium]|jgi:outer membrane protein assembly factor BamD|nr:outer membrane protein assembly factor BamD [Amoebophilaceae bacterium]